MIKFLVRKFVPNYEKTSDKNVREAYGTLGGVLGIICNIFLFALKLSIGIAMKSMAVISDSINNLSDTASSAITVFGSKMSNRRPDKEHPFGHGRIEYISSLVVSFIIMLVGFEFLKNSLDKIIHPSKIEFKLLLFVFLCMSVLVKLWMFSYNRYLGKQINSSVLKAAAFDSLNDVYATGTVIISIIIGNFTDLPVDGIMGTIVSGLVIFTGFKIARDTVSLLLGNSPSEEVVEQITETILSGEGIVGIHDLIVHEYGPGRIMASVHAEVPSDGDIVKIHEVIDALEQKILKDFGIHIVVHMDPVSVNCEKTEKLKILVSSYVKEYNSEFSIHDFRIVDGENKINLIFDMVVPCYLSEKEREKAVTEISEKLYNADNRFNVVINVDNAF
ncbi:MAG: cation diffusion facilitator family transporter [Oscillospiraceae bacterium]|jgi:cation diffusion facilitator family transporter|nr:cation diffusion facilitator family transporter [Oscillospiraceae bacterium]